MKKGLLFLAFCLICPEVLAAVFTVSPSDKSQQYLGMIFGSSVGAINLVASSYNATLSLMFERFNFIIVTVGALTLSYLGVISTINTAREGEAMGKKISMWVPMRAFTGMVLMVPGPTSGYSVVQMTVLWVILNGIGAANSIWNVVLGQLSQGVSTVSSSTLKPNDSTKTLTQRVLLANACMSAINNIPNLSAAPGPFQQYGPVKIYTIIKDPVINPNSMSQDAYLQVGLQGSGSSAPAPFDTMCGQFKVSTTLTPLPNDNGIGFKDNDGYNMFDSATLKQITTAKISAIQAMFTATEAGTQLMASSYLYTEDSYAKPDPGYVYAAQLAFLGQMSQIAQGSVKPKSLNSDYARLSGEGWIHAGSYYYELVKTTTKIVNPKTGEVPTTFSVPTDVTFTNNNPPAQWLTISGTPSTTTAFSILDAAQSKTLNTALSNANYYFEHDTINAISSSGITVSSPDTGNKLMNAYAKAMQNGIQNPVLEYIQGIMSGGDNKDPLLSAGLFGTTLMISAELATFLTLLLGFVATLAGSFASCMNPFPFAAITLFLQITPVLLGVFTMMWTMGATLGIYVPLIPYMIYTTTAFGWIIAVIEAVVGAPLVALSLTHPEGEELGKAGGALLILANLFLRPTLMIFGFVIATTLLRAGIAFINFGFIPALNTATSPSIFSVLAVLGMYVSLIMAIVTKSFSLIYMLPNQVMRWMGGPAENFDPSDMTKQAKEGFDSGAAKGQAIGDAANKSLSDKGAQLNEKKRTANDLAGSNRMEGAEGAFSNKRSGKNVKEAKFNADTKAKWAEENKTFREKNKKPDLPGGKD